MTKILTYGTFDLLHIGHINLLKNARALGDHLTVGLSTEAFNRLKNKETYYCYEQRKSMLEAIRYVDHIIPEENWEQKVNDISQYGVDVLVMGDDWKGRFDWLNRYCKVVYVARTKGISTTLIKNGLYLTHD